MIIVTWMLYIGSLGTLIVGVLTRNMDEPTVPFEFGVVALFVLTLSSGFIAIHEAIHKQTKDLDVEN